MLIDGRFIVPAAPEQVLAHLFDARVMTSCLPGCESIEALSDDRYRAVVAIALAGVKARFDLEVEITGRDAHGISAVTRGEEGGNASTLQATSDVRLTPIAEGTQVDYHSDVSVTGRLGRFALGMMKKKAQSVGDEFATNLQARLSEHAPASPVAAVASVAAVSENSIAADAVTADESNRPPVSDRASESAARASLGQRLRAWWRHLFAPRASARRGPR
jgi:carbon monoxide dehydrogenase subunit G